VGTFALLSLDAGGEIAPEWDVGLALGLGGLAGGFLGASIQTRLPEAALRRGLGVLAFALGVRYAVLALT
jgi:uncharacterized protein